MLPRNRFEELLNNSLRVNPVTALLGPRQCGKTTLARAVAAYEPGVFFDLEDPADLSRLSAPKLALRQDMVMRAPDIDMTFDFECLGCSNSENVDIPLTTEFFWPAGTR